MKSCLNCSHCHVAKDFEFNISGNGDKRYDCPQGKCFINIDLYWCDKPEQEDDDFSVLSFGTPDQFKKEHWFPQLASICEDYTPEG